MADVAFVVLLTVWAAALGRRLLGRFGLRSDDPLELLGLGVPLGLGALSLAVLGLGEAGILTRTALIGVGLVGALLGDFRPVRRDPAAAIEETAPGLLKSCARRLIRFLPDLLRKSPLTVWERSPFEFERPKALRSFNSSPEGAPCNSLGHRPRSTRHRIKDILSPEGAPCELGALPPGPHCAPSGLGRESRGVMSFLGRCPRLLHYALSGLTAIIPATSIRSTAPSSTSRGHIAEKAKSLTTEEETGTPRARTCLDLAFAGLLAAALLGTFLTALGPVTDGDALCYHLQVPKVFLARHAASFDPDLHETVYPLVTELIYAAALAFRGPIACRIVQWVLGLVFGANVVLLARPSLGARAWWAGTLALLVPAISNGMSAPLNDVALAAFGTAALVAYLRYTDQPDDARVLLAGTMAGLALGVKYPALVLTTLLGLLVASGGPRRARHVMLFGLAALLAGGWWYVRAAVATGNPVYPFFRHTFGGAGLDEVLDPIKRPLGPPSWNLLTALVPLTLQPDRFDSFSHQFGPVFLLFVPALLLERPPRRVWGLALLGYAFLTVCLAQRQSMRFVLLALGPLSVAAAWLADVWCRRRSLPARALVGLLVLALGFEAGLAAVRTRHGLGVLIGRESADHYLARCEPTYVVGGWVGRNLPPGARLIGQDHRGYYFPRPYTMELAHRRRTGLGRHGESAAETVARLRADGFTHVLLCPPVPENAVEFDPTLGRLLAPWLENRAALYRADLSDADGVVRRYALYALDHGETIAQAPHAERRRR